MADLTASVTTANRLPLVLPCHGGTRAPRLAVDVAAALGDLGVAEPVHDLDEAVEAAQAGRPVIALDGCASACRARLLEARGVHARATLSLADLGLDVHALPAADPARLAREAAQRLRSRSATRRARQLRPTRPPAAQRSKRLHDVDDYLLAIDTLASASVECGALARDAPALTAHVSRLLAVSRPSAGEMVARLEAGGLVTRGKHKELLLTANGRAAADRALRRHRLLERFACDYLGYARSECFDQARALDGAFDDDGIERLRVALGEPDRCPHGWPVDPEHARRESEELTALSALAEGERATIVRVSEHDGPLLARLDVLGLGPGAALTALQHPDDAFVTVRIGDAARQVDVDAAGHVFVRHATD